MKKILIVLILGGAIGVIVGYMMYNKKHTNVATTKADFSLTADELFQAFDAHYETARIDYEEKIIAVSGTVHSLDLSNDLAPQLVLHTSFEDGYIRCGFPAEMKAKIENLEEGKQITIKGICKGMDKLEGMDLLSDVDVVLSNCTIID